MCTISSGASWTQRQRLIKSSDGSNKLFSLVLIISHICSFGDKSGEWEGHGSKITEIYCKKLIVWGRKLTLCIGMAVQ